MLFSEVPPEPEENGNPVLSTLAIATTAAHVGGEVAAGFGWVFFLIPLFWIGLFVLLAVLFGRRRRAGWAPDFPGGPHWAPSRSAEASLAERFAQGDIDEKEYRARLEVLRASAHPQRPAK